jgi:hypothetical protein
VRWPARVDDFKSPNTEPYRHTANTIRDTAR